MNLAENLTTTAAEHPDAVAMKLDDAELTYAQLDAAAGAGRRTCCRSKGVEAGDRVGIMLPNVPYFAARYYGVLRLGAVVVPMNVLLKKREVGFYLTDPEAKLLFAWHDFAEAAEAGAAGGRRGADPGQAGRVRAAGRRAEPYTRGRRARRRRHRGDPLHLGHHRDAEGRRAHPLEPRPQRRGLLELHRHRPGLGRARGAAAVSLLRPDLRAQRGGPGRGLPDPDPALRPRQGAGDHRPRPGQRVRGRADDVRGDAQPPRARLLRHLVPRALRLGRLGDAGRGDEGLRGGLRRQDPRGLRALGDLAGRLLQPPRPRAQAGLDRHPDRGRGDEGGRRRRQRGRRRASRARS